MVELVFAVGEVVGGCGGLLELESGLEKSGAYGRGLERIQWTTGAGFGGLSRRESLWLSFEELSIDIFLQLRSGLCRRGVEMRSMFRLCCSTLEALRRVDVHTLGLLHPLMSSLMSLCVTVIL